MVKNPMNLSRMRKRLEQGVYESRRAGLNKFMEDVDWIRHNCVKFNGVRRGREGGRRRSRGREKRGREGREREITRGRKRGSERETDRCRQTHTDTQTNKPLIVSRCPPSSPADVEWTGGSGDLPLGCHSHEACKELLQVSQLKVEKGRSGKRDGGEKEAGRGGGVGGGTR